MRKDKEKEAFEIGPGDAGVYPDAVVVEVVVARITNTAMLRSGQLFDFACTTFLAFYVVYAVVGELFVPIARLFTSWIKRLNLQFFFAAYWPLSKHKEVCAPASEDDDEGEGFVDVAEVWPWAILINQEEIRVRVSKCLHHYV